MERGGRNNLGILAEEDDEEEKSEDSDDEVDDSNEETDVDEDDTSDGLEMGKKQGVPNKFDFLCDGVLSAISLVQGSLQEFLDLKDKMLQYSLPPTLQMQMAIVSGHLLRSISDLGVPVGELVRLVRVYAVPWEEKNAALKKLHEDYDSKQRQLNIAIKRLQLVDAHSKRMAKEKRIMNWEKLFSKMTSVRGHSRRWKFLIDTIKEKAKLGLEHVQAYTQSLESSESESEDEVNSEQTLVGEEKEDTHKTELENVQEEEEEEKDEEETPDVGGAESVVSHETEETESEESQLQSERSSSSPKKVRFEETLAPSRPPMQETSTCTNEPDYDRSLFIRVFNPEGFKHPELKCSISFNGKMYKTPVFTQLDEEIEDVTDGPISRRPQAARKGEERLRSGASAASPNEKDSKSKKKKFFEFEFRMPDEIQEGVLQFGSQPDPEPDNIRLAVHWGKFEEIIAISTIDFQEIKTKQLETVYLTPPHGDDNVAGMRARSNSSLSQAPSMDEESLSDSMDIPIVSEDEGPGTSTPKEDLVKTSEPLPYPLYSLHIGKSDSVQAPSGTLPLLMYWGKRVRPKYFNRQCGTLGVYDLVYDLTGIDLSVTTKEDLHKDMTDKALSALSFSPETAETETRPRSEMDRVIERHQEEMMYLQEEYERRIQDLLNTLDTVQTDNDRLSQLATYSQKPGSARLHPASPQHRPISGSSHLSLHQQRPLSVLSQRSVSKHSTPSNDNQVTHQSNREGQPNVQSNLQNNTTLMKKVVPPTTAKPSKNFRVGRPLPKWGENLPQDFFQRLRLWEEESKQHKDELNAKTLKDIKDNLEKKLAGQHKLSKHEEQIYDALKDVSLPALFMPYKRGNIYNPRAHQYFHPTGASEVRLTQPPSVFQLPPLPLNKVPVVNLFELSQNFHNQGPAWLVERYIQQQQPGPEDSSQTVQSTSVLPQVSSMTRQETFPDTMVIHLNCMYGCFVDWFEDIDLMLSIFFSIAKI
uniref:Uncharacterized protein n=1 Tax=Biomphalaria glabrata TaxID=6526 RepID=A0A2C9LC74_BIOGL